MEVGELYELLAVRLDDEVVGTGRLLGDRHDPRGLAGRSARGVKQEVPRLSLGDERCAAGPRQLCRELADVARCSRNTYALAGAQAAVNDECLPRAECAHRERRRLDVRELRWLRGKQGRGYDRVLPGDAIAVKRGEGEHRLAG